ncbi:Uncharacterised protein [Trueperella pyogenes]|nr:hypothetical protein [Trueperella pyogenes]SUO86708.1 Uncharacterised protein [Trueperella pyogenes]
MGHSQCCSIRGLLTPILYGAFSVWACIFLRWVSLSDVTVQVLTIWMPNERDSGRGALETGAPRPLSWVRILLLEGEILLSSQY